MGIRSQIREDEGVRAACKLEGGCGTVFDTCVSFIAIRHPLEIPHDPHTVIIPENIAHHVGIVGTPVGHAILGQSSDGLDVADGALSDQVPCQIVGRKEAALMAYNELNAVAPARHQHLLGVSQSVGHGLFAEDCLGFARRRSDSHFSVAAVPGADRNDIRLFPVQHLPSVGVVLWCDAEFGVNLRHGGLVMIRQCRDFEAAGFQVTIDVVPPHAAGSDNSDTMFLTILCLHLICFQVLSMTRQYSAQVVGVFLPSIANCRFADHLFWK